MDKLAQEAYAGFDERARMIMTRAALNPSPAPDTPWGAINQALGTLWLDEMRDRWPDANRALVSLREKAPVHPHDLTEPSVYWGLGALVRTYFLFHRNSPHFPGRLTPEAEDVIKELLWNFVYGRSRLDDARTDQSWTIYDSENHDMMHKTVYYLAAALFARDPDYSVKRYNDGGTPAEHEAAWAEWFKEYLKARATHGLWVEQNSSTYVKYTLASLVNVYDFSPDPALRQRVKMTLDITLIDWAQEQIFGVRGGGGARMLGSEARTQAHAHSTWGIGWLLFGGVGGFSYAPSQQLFASSGYRPSEFAVALAHLPRSHSYEVRNRVLGEGTSSSVNLIELARQRFGEAPRPAHQRQSPPIYYLSPDSQILHYSYVTPYYVLGMNIQNPNATYTLIATQGLWAGAVMPTRDNPSARIIVDPVDVNGDGIHFDAFWGVQDKSAMIVQQTRHARGAGDMRIYFAPGLERTERDGWIFASNGMAFAGVRIAWGGHQWSGSHAVLRDSESPFILQMGTIEEFGSFDGFIDAVLRSPLYVDQERIVYRGPQTGELTFYHRPRSGPEARRLGRYILPEVDGIPVDLRPPALYSSPYLKAEFGSSQIEVQLGKDRAVFDFDGNRVLRSESTLDETPSWMTLHLHSPQEGETVSGPALVAAAVESARPIAQVRVALDGAVLHEGPDVPRRLVINQGELDDGAHTLTLTAFDDRGETFQRSYRFSVDNVRLTAPRPGERISGRYLLALENALPPEQVANVSIQVGDLVLYRGDSLPATLEIDTLLLPDGQHELTVSVQTTSGARAEGRVAFSVQNYWTLEDLFEAPTTNWFGVAIDRSKTVASSSGWEYTSGGPGRLFGFQSGKTRKANTTEYLVWAAPNLTSFAVDLVAPASVNVQEAVRLAVSSDGATWIDVPFHVGEAGPEKGGWRHVSAFGDRLSVSDVRLFRLSLLESDAEAQKIQVGRVRIAGLQSKPVEE